MPRVMLVFGTRPDAIKMAPVCRLLAEEDGYEPIVAVTAQHRTILDQVLELFAIVPAHDLDILSPRQTLTDVTTRALEGLAPVLQAEQPDLVVVQGDTTTTFVGALAAFYAQMRVAHLEAGLRTGDRRSPFPEEINRRLTTQLADLHLAPTASARGNLLADGVESSAIHITGNTVIDALHWTVDQRAPYGDPVLEEVDRDPRRVVLVTAHRRESWGTGIRDIGRALGSLGRRHPKTLFVFPIHPNPVVRDSITPNVVGLENVLLVEPLPYAQFARLMSRSAFILTDSGGVQEEGPSLGKPVLVMRDTTERPEAVEAGTARLIGTDTDRIVAEVDRLLGDDDAYAAMANAVNPYGDGQAARRTLAAFDHLLCGGPAPDPFTPQPRSGLSG